MHDFDVGLLFVTRNDRLAHYLIFILTYLMVLINITFIITSNHQINKDQNMKIHIIEQPRIPLMKWKQEAHEP